MANPAKEGVRIIKRHKKNHGGHHGGAWKVAYADFVTAMMAFFLVMWIVGMNSSVKEAIACYFKDPVGFMQAANKGKLPIAIESPGVLSVPETSPQIQKDKMEYEAKLKEDRKRLERAKYALQKVIEDYPEFRNVKDSIRVTVANDGLRIDLVETRADLFFDSGSATTKPGTRQLLKKISNELGRLPNKVVIEGHTDSRPYSGRNGWTNWELSTARANAARCVMEAAGIKPKQIIEVRGLADTLPLDPKHRDSFKNRRVSILIPFQGLTDQLLPPDVSGLESAPIKTSIVPKK